MADIKELTPKELKEIQDYIKGKDIDIQIKFAPQKIRRMEDGGLVIDPPQFSTHFVKIQTDKKGNGNLEVA